MYAYKTKQKRKHNNKQKQRRHSGLDRAGVLPCTQGYAHQHTKTNPLHHRKGHASASGKIKSLDVLFSILFVSSASCSKCLAKQIDRCADGFMQMYVQYIYFVDSR